MACRNARFGRGVRNVFIAVHIEEKDEKRKQQRSENNPPEAEHRNTDQNTKHGDEGVNVGQFFLKDKTDHVIYRAYDKESERDYTHPAH